MLVIFFLVQLLQKIQSFSIKYEYIKYTEESDLNYKNKWIEFKKSYDKIYNEEEEKARIEIFESNYAKIIAHNKLFDEGKVSYKMGINFFTDMNDEEILTKFTGLKNKKLKTKKSNFVGNYDFDIPTNFDWRTKNVVTPVKNQGHCGSCYSFSATGSLEGQYALHNKKLISLSEQNIIDCSLEFGNEGCSGGLMDQVFDYVIINKGIDTEEMYPYKAKDGKCKYVQNPFPLTSYMDVNYGNETELMYSVYTIGPISVGINVQKDFVAYKSGIYSNSSCDAVSLNHGVLLVGYGVENGNDYWLVKNSWGEDWGMDGYIKMSRNKNNQCGIASMACYPKI